MNDLYEKVKRKTVRKKKIHTKVSRSVAGNVAVISILFIVGLFTALPLYLAVINSLKPLDELFLFPPRFYVLNPTLKNYSDMFAMMNNSTIPFTRYIFNTTLITVIGTVGQVFVASMCAYPLAKHPFPGSKVFFRVVVLSLMFSTAVTGIPNFLLMARIGWVDTYWAVIVPAIGASLGLYLMKQFMEQIPDALLESAKIDGANEWDMFWKIVMPQVKPAWLTLTVFSVQSLWSFGETNMIYSENLKSIAYALGQITSSGIARTGVTSAITVTMMSIPILVFIITQSRVIETMSSSGIKE